MNAEIIKKDSNSITIQVTIPLSSDTVYFVHSTSMLSSEDLIQQGVNLTGLLATEHALSRFDTVKALCFDYGQRHVQEVAVAQKIAEKVGVPFLQMETRIISQLAESSLTNPALIMDEEKPRDTWPNTFVPGRNLIFLTFAAVIARSHQIWNIITGVSQADYSGYPDCREPFIRSTNTTINMAMDEQFVIHTPLMWLNKAEIWALADELGVFELVKNETLTCYHGIMADGCGICPACRLRKKGMEEFLEFRIKN